MPVRNALPYLDAAVESILGQTFSNFEFVILDDASNDGSVERLRDWARRDQRIRLIEEPNNLGPALSSQRVALAANAQIVARMDADDISLPHRLTDQLRVLDEEADVGVVGGLYDIIAPDGRVVRRPEKWRLLAPRSVPPFGNGPLTYRREVFDQVGGYRRECEFWEDNDLIQRMAAVSRIMVLPYSVYQVRQARVSNRLSANQDRVERAVDLMYRARERIDKGEAYEDIIASGLPNDRKVSPKVFISLGSITLWAGERPRLFGRLLKRGDLGFNRQSLAALVWTAWAAAEPRSLRAFIRLLLFGRKVRANRVVRTNGPVQWPMAHPSDAASQALSHQRYPVETAPALSAAARRGAK